MLVLKRKEGQWTEIVHHSGDVLRIKFYPHHGPTSDRGTSLNVVFDDAPRHFEIRRPERKHKAPVRYLWGHPIPHPEPAPQALGPGAGAEIGADGQALIANCPSDV